MTIVGDILEGSTVVATPLLTGDRIIFVVSAGTAAITIVTGTANGGLALT